MHLEGLSVDEIAPSAIEYRHLRALVGWSNDLDEQSMIGSLTNSLYHVTLRNNDQLVGMARVVGDGYMYFYIQDVVVHPDWQRCGIGHLLMEKVEDFLKLAAGPGATVGLFAAKGKEGFYRDYGYLERTGSELGLGMCRFVN
ncbi:GNAT family N-acetyltransferase [Bowmanella yangjiangensis]|uniref:GNAT family N-acetyltransferase n=1 Tax=Bowmanella yangjiangensis TaxID=2811230 RepID=A0ABS3CV89_9ALTE|nr:GNAT family N-acetyltransferase [Bowmanella yangjiangensis]MBN7821038.1 GNAT family N-acetyltransferase [Bowmanella yangjiangensis]